MLHESKAVISGSQIVQFFDRRTFPGSDMDIYVSEPSAPVVGNWLEKNGYRYTGSYGVYASLPLEESLARSILRRNKLTNALNTSTSIRGVYNYGKKDRRIQVIVLSINPLKHILFEFHSSESYKYLNAYSHTYNDLSRGDEFRVLQRDNIRFPSHNLH